MSFVKFSCADFVPKIVLIAPIHILLYTIFIVLGFYMQDFLIKEITNFFLFTDQHHTFYTLSEAYSQASQNSKIELLVDNYNHKKHHARCLTWL